MAGYIGPAPVPQATQNREAFTATSGQTSFATAGYTPQFIDVYLNGVKLAAADYTATNGSDVVLASGATANDILEVVAFSAFTVADQAFTGTTTAANLAVTGTFTSRGIDDNADAVAITIDSSENVGIGVTPTERLDIQTTAGRFKVKALGGSSVELESNSAVKLKAAVNDVILDGASNIIFDIADTEKMRIDSSGNVGIGRSPTAVGSYKMLELDGISGGYIRNYVNGTFTGYWYTGLGASGFGTATSTPLTFDTSNSERMRIDSNGRVAIGGTAVTDVNMLNIQGSGASSNIGIVFNDTNTSKVYGIQNGGSTLKFFDYTASAERMRIDSSGNVLVGTTTATGVGNSSSPEGIILSSSQSQIIVATSSDVPLYLNRQTTDGDIAVFRKNGTTVGSISVTDGDNLVISSTATDHGGLKFNNTAMAAYVNGASSDGTMSIGTSVVRFSDLYLSGGVYLGGVGAANKLDDYEEGAWTPSLLGASVSGTTTYGQRDGWYRKIGDVVICHCMIFTTAHTGSGLAEISGLPFSCNEETVGEAQINGHSAAFPSSNGGLCNLSSIIQGGQTKIHMRGTYSDTTSGPYYVQMQNFTYLRITLTYKTS